MTTKKQMEHVKDVITRSCTDCLKSGCEGCDVKDARMTVDKMIALDDTAANLLADFQRANAEFLGAEKALYDAGSGVNSDDKLVHFYNAAYDARLNASAAFASCVSSAVGEVVV